MQHIPTRKNAGRRFKKRFATSDGSRSISAHGPLGGPIHFRKSLQEAVRENDQENAAGRPAATDRRRDEASLLYLAATWAGRIGQSFDALLDLAQGLETGFQPPRPARRARTIGRDPSVAQAVEFVDKLTAAPPVRNRRLARRSFGSCRRSKKPMFDETIEQPHQRNRLQFEHVRRDRPARAPPARANRNSTIHCARVVPRVFAR